MGGTGRSVETTSGLRIVELAPRLFAVIGAGGDSNSGFVGGARGAVVSDAQQNEALARELLGGVEKAGGGPVRLLVNTHYHADQVFGNAAFAPHIDILAHARCRAALTGALGAAGVAPGALLPERLAMRLGFGATLYDLVPEGDPTLESFRRLYEASGYARARVRLPTVTIDTECTFHLAERRIVLRYLGPGHTDGDLVVWLPDDGVMFAADLVFCGRFPWLGDSDVAGWIARLDEIIALHPRVVVPGHGAPVTCSDVVGFRDLLCAAQRSVLEAIRAGLDEPTAVREVRVPAYEHLPRYAEWFPGSIRKLYRDFTSPMGVVRGKGSGAVPGPNEFSPQEP